MSRRQRVISSHRLAMLAITAKAALLGVRAGHCAANSATA
jgi:hypothetical protein